jgi:hypothetical protein
MKSSLASVIVCFTVLAIGCGKSSAPSSSGAGAPPSKSETEVATKEKVEVVDLGTLFSFAGKPDEAFKKYGDKLLELEGAVFEESNSAGDKARVVTLMEANRPAQGLIPTVRCQFELGSPSYEKAALLSQGQKVKVRGRYEKDALPRLVKCELAEIGPNPLLAVTAAQLTKEFAADEKAALAKYKDKPVAVEGVVAELKHVKDQFLEAHTVILEGSGPMTRVEVFNVDKTAFAKLKKGETAKIKGKLVTGNASNVQVLYRKLLAP